MSRLSRLACAVASIVLLVLPGTRAAWAQETSCSELVGKACETTDSAFADQLSLKPSEPFSTSLHKKLTPGEQACSEVFNRAIYLQDFLQQHKSAAHFDNCAFGEGADYIQELLVDADLRFKQPVMGSNRKLSDDFLAGLLSLGQVLHAIQDFYAHSDFVEIQSRDTSISRLKDVVLPTMWNSQGRQTMETLVSQRGLRSGTWAIGGPKKCSVNAVAHEALNKDSNKSIAGKVRIERWNRTQYEVAYELAREASKRFLRDSAQRWPALKVCGGTLALMPLHERRTEEKK